MWSSFRPKTKGHIFLETIRFLSLSWVRFFPHLLTQDVLNLCFFQRTLPDIHPLQRWWCFGYFRGPDSHCWSWRLLLQLPHAGLPLVYQGKHQSDRNILPTGFELGIVFMSKMYMFCVYNQYGRCLIYGKRFCGCSSVWAFLSHPRHALCRHASRCCKQPPSCRYYSVQ